jgi:hypothetical protein
MCNYKVICKRVSCSYCDHLETSLHFMQVQKTTVDCRTLYKIRKCAQSPFCLIASKRIRLSFKVHRRQSVPFTLTEFLFFSPKSVYRVPCQMLVKTYVGLHDPPNWAEIEKVRKIVIEFRDMKFNGNLFSSSRFVSCYSQSFPCHAGFLLFEPWGCQRTKSGGDLDLYYKDRALMTWTFVKGHKGPVKGLRASGPQGPDPLFNHTHTQSLPCHASVAKN